MKTDVNTFKNFERPYGNHRGQRKNIYDAFEISQNSHTLRENGGNELRFCMVGFNKFNILLWTPMFYGEFGDRHQKLMYNICKLSSLYRTLLRDDKSISMFSIVIF